MESGVLDSGLPDSGAADSGPPDSGVVDSGAVNSGPLGTPGEVVCGDTTCVIDSGLPECCMGTVGRAISTTACVSDWAACEPQGDYITAMGCDEDSDCAPDAGCYEVDNNTDVYNVQCCTAEDLYTISFNATSRYLCQTPSTTSRACPAGTQSSTPGRAGVSCFPRGGRSAGRAPRRVQRWSPLRRRPSASSASFPLGSQAFPWFPRFVGAGL